MLIQIPDVLTPRQLAHARRLLDAAPWIDGRATAGHQSARVKHNLQIPDSSPEAQELGAMVLAGLERHPLFIAAALPKRIFPPLFNLYRSGQAFGTHVDNAIRQLPDTTERIRTDLSCTLFFTGPDEYDGGELVVEDTYGVQRIKLPAGHMILYPATSLHHVTPVTRGARICSFFWLQSLVRSAGRRSMLFDLDNAIQQIRVESADHPAAVQLTGVYHNLIREWAEL